MLFVTSELFNKNFIWYLAPEGLDLLTRGRAQKMLRKEGVLPANSTLNYRAKVEREFIEP